MSKQLKKSRKDRQLIYHKPKVHLLRNVKEIQSYYTGKYLEGPSSQYWYS